MAKIVFTSVNDKILVYNSCFSYWVKEQYKQSFINYINENLNRVKPAKMYLYKKELTIPKYKFAELCVISGFIDEFRGSTYQDEILADYEELALKSTKKLARMHKSSKPFAKIKK